MYEQGSGRINLPNSIALLQVGSEGAEGSLKRTSHVYGIRLWS